jgi:serine/threonine protein kinase
MEGLARKVLQLGGFQTDESSDKDPLECMEAWLGMTEPTLQVEDSMEDAAPFDKEFYQSLEELLLHVWTPDLKDQPQLLHSNPFLELECPPHEMSLEKALGSVRVTRLLRFWMELNVLGNNTMLEKEDDARTSLSHSLLQVASQETTPSGRQVYRLLYAIYHHVEQLPFMQSQLYFYTQSLMKSDRSSWASGVVVVDAQSRLERYKVTQDITTKLNQQWDDHIDALEYILGEWYEMGSADMRRQARTHLGSVWAHFVARSSGGGGSGVKMENTTSSGIRMTLRILHRILKGTSNTLHKSHEHLLQYHLIPLHRPSSMVLWRDQTSLLELYHEPLVQCIAILLQKKPEWIPMTISALLEPEVWNNGGNTPKLVLLLHEIDTYISVIPNPKENPSVLGDTWPILLRLVGSCMASDHSRLAERALAFIKTKNFLTLLLGRFEISLQILLPFLVKNEPSWNPTVRKMTYYVLKTLQDFDDVKFMEVSERCFPTETIANGSNPMSPNTIGGSTRAEGTAHIPANDRDELPGPTDFSLKSAMGGWKPPSVKSTHMDQNSSARMLPPSNRAPRAFSKTPPLGITGVAPWSVSNASRPASGLQASRSNPPLGITGVAPWAMQRTSPGGKHQAVEALSEVAEDESPADSTEEKDIPKPTSRVLTFMEKVKPPEVEEGASAWSKAQMGETPTLLPELKFHDLVFGHDLGSGAFGSVRYARLIDRNRTRSQWAEYAVKIISTEKIKEMGYEASVQREMAVLRILSHPGIARLVSSFRFHEGVYLVLEYASGGDLHSLLRKNGSLDHDSTRFVMGEVVAALASIHELGLVYSDLKPENVVITESGHVKLTDFGGCRPVTREAKELIRTTARNILKDLRDGGWKSKSTKSKTKESYDMEEDSNEESENDCVEVGDMESDLRIEGTTAYLPPEVVMGGFPTFAADSWALGCVIYQCLSGRPPLLEADDSATRSRIVSFDAGGGSSSGPKSSLFSEAHALTIEADARALIVSLLSRTADERPSMQQAAQADFFAIAGTNVFALYTQSAPPLDVGDVTPVADAQWTRRQFSSIWAPQPQAYDIALTSRDMSQSRGATVSAAIAEGTEAAAFFSKSTNPMDLSSIADTKPPMRKL